MRCTNSKVCAQFVALCRELGLLTQASVAIDGSKLGTRIAPMAERQRFRQDVFAQPRATPDMPFTESNWSPTTHPKHGQPRISAMQKWTTASISSVTTSCFDG